MSLIVFSVLLAFTKKNGFFSNTQHTLLVPMLEKTMKDSRLVLVCTEESPDSSDTALSLFIVISPPECPTLTPVFMPIGGSLK